MGTPCESDMCLSYVQAPNSMHVTGKHVVEELESCNYGADVYNAAAVNTAGWGEGYNEGFSFKGGGTQPWRHWAHHGREEHPLTTVVGNTIGGRPRQLDLRFRPGWAGRGGLVSPIGHCGLARTTRVAQSGHLHGDSEKVEKEQSSLQA